MKRCPSCGESFGNDVKFCDADGSPLVAEPASTKSQSEGQPRTKLVLATGLVLGLAVGAAVIALYRPGTHEGGSDSTHTAPSAPPAAASTPRPLRVEPEASPSASPSPEPTPTAVPSPTPSPPRPPRGGVESLSDSPATIGGPGGRAPGRIVLHLTDGSRVEAEDAWRAPEGVWYRRGGIAQLLDRSRIASVERLAEPTP